MSPRPRISRASFLRAAGLRPSDVRGAARLAADATVGLTDLVEALHARIARVPLPGRGEPPSRTRGITGLVYRSIRGVTRLTGGSVDSLLALLTPMLSAQSREDVPPPQREALLAALNGVIGDELAARANPLATPMNLRRDGRPLALDRAALARRLPDSGGDVVVLLHGLCMNDLQWQRGAHDHGAALARDAGWTPVYLHYNTGLHVSTNGRQFAQMLETALEQWPCPVRRLALLGHSMGGLVARSAWHHGVRAGHRWPARLDDLVFLGTPHHGAPLERAGHWVDIVLEAAPYASPFARLGKLRSAGITDLRHGNLVDADWAGRDRFAHWPDRRAVLALPAGVRCHALAASIGRRRGDLKDRLLGDGLVPLDSALGLHPDPRRVLAFAASRQWVGYGLNHLDLLDHPRVYVRLRRALA